MVAIYTKPIRTKFLECAKVKKICTKYTCEECIPLAKGNASRPTANRVAGSSRNTKKLQEQLKSKNSEVTTLKKKMKALRSKFKKMNEPNLETVEDGDEVSLLDIQFA